MISNLIRGFLIGTAEVIPGVSGGTIALLVGIYERIIAAAAFAVDAMVNLIRFRPEEAKKAFKRIDFRLVLPVLAGMLAAIFAAAALLEPLLESEPENMRGLFAGLILASLIVPYKMVGGRWGAKDFLLLLGSAAVAFGLVSLPRQELLDINLFALFLAAAVAVCALVLPGVSGSFLLLALGFYGPTLSAVNDRDFGYLAVFVLGAATGLGFFAKGLSWLLENRRRITLVVMTGLMLGSLRALWPWQDEAGSLQEPAGFMPAASFILGVLTVGALLQVQSRANKAQ